MNPCSFRFAVFLLMLSVLSAHSAPSSSAKTDAQNKPSKPSKPSRVSNFVSSLIWKYQTTADKKTKLGRKGQEMSIETLKARVQITAPANWKIVSCLDEQLNWDFVATARDAGVGFGIKVVSFPGNPSLESRFQNYLAGIQKGYDPTVQMTPEVPYTTADKKTVPAYFYFGNYWGTRMVIMMTHGDITTVIEFLGPSAVVLHAAHPVIQKILNTYSYRKL
ncbi:MAG: hypothetical protein ABI615_09565 [Chthoniobacterales bacterium]